MIVISGANSRVTIFATHPNQPSRTFLFSGSTKSDLRCHKSKAASIAKQHCWSSSPDPMKALKAVEEPR